MKKTLQCRERTSSTSKSIYRRQTVTRKQRTAIAVQFFMYWPRNPRYVTMAEVPRDVFIEGKVVMWLS
ncbi:hypothetical protein Peur_027576 [Populus x canadensis]